MVDHPIDTAIVNGLAVNKGAGRAAWKKAPIYFDTAATFRTYQLPNTPNAIIAQALYYYDAADLTTADDGTICIHDFDGRRFKMFSLVGMSYATRAAAIAATIPTYVTAILVLGHTTQGIGAATYKEVADTGTLEAWQFRSNGATRRWQIAEDIIDPKMLGAIGDGTADDTAAINSAIAIGKIVSFGPSNYKITSALTALGVGQGLRGDGAGKSTLTISGNGYDAVSLGSDYAFVEDIFINSSASKTSGKAIKIASATRGNAVRRCKFNNQFRGVSIDGNAVITYLEDLEIINTTPTTGVCIDINGGNDTYLSGILADNPPGSQPGAGLRVAGSQAIWATDCDFVHCGNGVLIDPSSGTTTWLFFTTCAFDSGSQSGANIAPSGTANVKGLFFNGCWFASNTSRGVVVQKSGSAVLDGVYFDQCKALNNGQQGFLCLAGPTNVHISNPVVSGNSQTTSGLDSGIDFQANATDFSVQGGRSGQMMGFGNTQARGILVNGGTSTNYTIQGVDVRNNVSAGISDGGSGTGRVQDNLGYNPVGPSAITVTASPFTYTAGKSPETIYITGGTVSLIVQGGVTLFTATEKTVHLEPNEAVVVTYSVAPTMNKQVH